MSMGSKLPTAEQAAELLQTDAGTLRRLARQRWVPAMEVGWQWRFDETVLREWVSELGFHSIAPARTVTR